MKNISKKEGRIHMRTLNDSSYRLLLVFGFLFTSLCAHAAVPFHKSEICSDYRLVDEGMYTLENPSFPSSEDSFLWRVETPSGNFAGFLFGNVHSDDKEVIKKARQTLPLLALVDRYISEVKHEPGLNLGSLLKIPEPISSQLSEGFLELYKATLASHGLDFEQFDQFPAWFNFSQLSRPKTSSFNTDKMFVDEALTIQKYGGGFETATDLVGQLNQLSNEEQLTVLKEVLCNYDLVSSQNQQSLDFYLKDQVLESYRASHRYHSGNTELYKKFMASVVFERNQTIASEISSATARRPIFATLGFAHLIGEKGVPYLLQKKGFRLTPISERVLSEITDDLILDAKRLLEEYYLPKFQFFLNKSSQYQIPKGDNQLPPLRFVPQSKLQEIACEGTPCPILGLYDSSELKLARSLIPSILGKVHQQVGIVFHEYVHFVQESYGDSKEVSKQTPTEWALREKEANLLQLRFTHWMKTGQEL